MRLFALTCVQLKGDLKLHNKGLPEHLHKQRKVDLGVLRMNWGKERSGGLKSVKHSSLRLRVLVCPNFFFQSTEGLELETAPRTKWFSFAPGQIDE